MSNEWIVALIVTCINTAFTTVIGLVIKHYVNKTIKKKQDAEEELINLREEKRREEYKKDIRDSVEEVVKPIVADVASIKNQVDGSKQATVASLRALMKQSRDAYMKQGYADIGDKATWQELYKDYASLGGNNFKEYVNSWRNNVLALPDKPVKKANANSKKEKK